MASKISTPSPSARLRQYMPTARVVFFSPPLQAPPAHSAVALQLIPLRFIRCSQRACRLVFLCQAFRFFTQPFSSVVVVFASFVPQYAHTTTSYIKNQARAVIPSLITFVPRFIRSLIPALAQPTKKLHYAAKTYASPAFST